ncbi:MAG: type II secretion system protein GspG, partial [Planctomycetia bacterium]|nr:type II secretion system protein GspG [Planctomycetia bacterium]
MTLPQDTKIQPHEAPNSAVPEGSESVKEPSEFEISSAEAGCNPQSESDSTNTDTQTSEQQPLDYAEIVRTLQRHAESSDLGCGLMIFFGVITTSLLIFSEKCDFLLHIVPFCVLLSFIILFWTAIQNGRLTRRLTQLTGCRQGWFSFQPDVIDQVQQLLTEAGIDPKADPDGDPAAFCPKLPVQADSTLASVPEPKRPFSWKAFFLGLFWSVILFICFAVLAGGISAYVFRQPWSTLYHAQRETFYQIDLAQEKLKTYYDEYGHYPQTLTELKNKPKENKNSSNKTLDAKSSFSQSSPSQTENATTSPAPPEGKVSESIQPPIAIVQQTGSKYTDGWERPLYYGTDGQSWRIVSYGANGQPGGEGLDADIDWNNRA